MFTHTCSCGTQYQSADADPYLCEACTKKRKAIAAEVDKKRASIVSKPRASLLQEYDAAPKVRGFVPAKYLGL